MLHRTGMSDETPICEFEVLMTVSMKIVVFWEVMPHSWVGSTSVLEKPATCIVRKDFYPEDVGIGYLQNVGLIFHTTWHQILEDSNFLCVPFICT
jgi:hypothetical protein